MSLIDFAAMNRPEMPQVDISTGLNTRTFTIDCDIEDYTTIGKIKLDLTHPLCIRYIAACGLANQASDDQGKRYRAFEEANGIFSGLWAAFKVKLAEPGFHASMKKSDSIKSTVQVEFRKLLSAKLAAQAA